MPTIHGASGNDTLHGSAEGDTIYGGGGQDKLNGHDGDDFISALGAHGQTGINGQAGNDTLEGSVPGSGQIHMRGGTGDDLIIFDVTNTSGHQGHHAYGGTGADRFEFRHTSAAISPILGRIDDFDASRDSIWLDTQQLNLNSLPANVAIVLYLGQQWLKIGDTILYAIEGARDGGAERHFSPFPSDINDLPQVNFIDQVNFVPYQMYQTDITSLTEITSYQPRIAGTNGDDLITTDKAASVIAAGTGNDVINAGKGADVVFGGAGDDKIAGGMDDDILRGDNGRDILFGGSENDTIYGGADDDLLHGGTGDDKLIGNAGNDTLNGNQGSDTLGGHGGNDILRGQNGDDRLYGQRGHDTLHGGAGNDHLFGAVGNDILHGGKGADVAFGGAGADVFTFETGDLIDWNDLRANVIPKNAQLDHIEDFVIGTDVIAFEAYAGVSSRADLRCWKTVIDNNVYFTLQVRDTNERLLVDVADGTSWGDFFNDTNIIFA